MQTHSHASTCSICGSYRSGGIALIAGGHVRCPACQADAPERAERRSLLQGLMRRLRVHRRRRAFVRLRVEQLARYMP